MATSSIVVQHIGYGAYQGQLFVMCGFGWLVDNLILQSLAVILPQLQRNFVLSDSLAGLTTSATFLGMIIGASLWGVLADTYGRKLPFNATLLITAAALFLATFSSNYASLCFFLFLMGTGVGGNLPTDGTLFLEFLPKSHHSRVTLLSLFWPLGQLIASILGWIFIPLFPICPIEISPNPHYLSPEAKILYDATRNSTNRPSYEYFKRIKLTSTESRLDICMNPVIPGWRILLFCIAVITLGMACIRTFYFRVLESPEFLISRNRRNRELKNVGVVDEEREEFLGDSDGSGDRVGRDIAKAVEVINKLAKYNGSNVRITAEDLNLTQPESEAAVEDDGEEIINSNTTHIHSAPSSFWANFISRHIPNQIKPLFEEKVIMTTILVWLIWMLVSIGYTVFNSFLPKYLGGSEQDEDLNKIYRRYLIISIAGIPGSFLGAYLVDSALGRKGTMSISTLGTAICMLILAFSEPDSQLIPSCFAAFLQNVMYGVLYAYTPEVFEAKHRGTATGIASALGRIVGVFAPILAGILFSITPILPLFASFVFLCGAAICMVLLPVETRNQAVE